MSVWVSLGCMHCKTEVFDCNLTYNLAPMWRAAGIELDALKDHLAADCLQKLRGAVSALEADPEKFRAMNPPNGWGSYGGLLSELTRMLKAFSDYPSAKVRFSG